MKKIVCAALVLSFATPALAQQRSRPGFDPNKWNVLFAVGPFIAPEYEGARRYRVLPLPFIRATKGNYFIQTEGPGLTANIINDPNFNAGPSLEYRGERDDDVNNPILKQFETVNSSVEAGGFISYRFPTGPRGEGVTAKIKAMFDIGDAHNGYTLSNSLSYAKPIGTKLRLGLSVSATYADQNYNNTYFGINAFNAAQSGFQTYQAGSGIKDIGGTLNLIYSIDEQWGLVGLFGYKKLVGASTDSPIIKNIGTSNQFLGSIALSYRF